jgi:hypothetical protein
MGEKQMKIGNLNQLKAEIFRFLVILLVALTAAIAVSSCHRNVIVGEKGYYIYGMISESFPNAPNAPLDSAWTAWRDTTADRRSYSDSVGNYRQQVPAGADREIYVGKPGYRTKTVYLGNVTQDRHGVNVVLAPVS